MALELLVNHALQRCVDFHWSESDQTIQYHSALGFVAGPRHVISTSPLGASYARLQYAANTGFGTLNRFILSRADLLLTHALGVSWNTNAWTGTATDLFTSSNFAATLIGPKTQDYLLEYTAITTAKGLYLSLDNGTGGAYTRKIGKAFWSEKFALDYLELQYPQRQPLWESVRAGSKNFLVQERITFKWKHVTSAQIRTFLALFQMHGDKREPFFIYDPQAFYLPEKLLHVVKDTHQIVYKGDDVHDLTLTVFVLRYYDA